MILELIGYDLIPRPMDDSCPANCVVIARAPDMKFPDAGKVIGWKVHARVSGNFMPTVRIRYSMH